jgi:hypothetical protein
MSLSSRNFTKVKVHGTDLVLLDEKVGWNGYKSWKKSLVAGLYAQDKYADVLRLMRGALKLWQPMSKDEGKDDDPDSSATDLSSDDSDPEGNEEVLAPRTPAGARRGLRCIKRHNKRVRKANHLLYSIIWLTCSPAVQQNRIIPSVEAGKGLEAMAALKHSFARIFG